MNTRHPESPSDETPVARGAAVPVPVARSRSHEAPENAGARPSADSRRRPTLPQVQRRTPGTTAYRAVARARDAAAVDDAAGGRRDSETRCPLRTQQGNVCAASIINIRTCFTPASRGFGPRPAHSLLPRRVVRSPPMALATNVIAPFTSHEMPRTAHLTLAGTRSAGSRR